MKCHKLAVSNYGGAFRLDRLSVLARWENLLKFPILSTSCFIYFLINLLVSQLNESVGEDENVCDIIKVNNLNIWDAFLYSKT